MRFLRTNTAVIVTVGPFYDRTDGVTIETALTITNERITLTADTDAGAAPTNILDNIAGATAGTANDLNYITGNDAGMMQLELAAADVNRLGRMFLSITDAANHVPVFHEFIVLPAMIYDAFVLGTDVLDASITQILGTATATPATAGIIEVNVRNFNNLAAVALPLIPTVAGRTLDVSAAGEAGLDWSNIGSPTTAQNLSATNIDVDQVVASVSGAVGSVTGAVGSVAAGGITAASIATGAIDADALATDAVTEIRSLVSGTSDSGTTTTMVDAARTEADTDYWTGDIILFTSGTIANQARVITAFDPATDTLTFTPATTQAVATQTYEILAGARTVLAGITHTSARIPNVTLTDTVTTYTGNTPQTGDSFARLGLPVGASVSADIAGIQADTDNVQARLPAVLVAGRLDSSVGAMAANVVTASSLATDAVQEIRDAVTDDIIDVQGNYTVQQALSIILAATAGVTDTGGVVLRTPNGVAVRITAVVNASNERTSIVLTPSA